MAKKRTRKQKVQAVHPFTVSWQPDVGARRLGKLGTNVNSQLASSPQETLLDNNRHDLATLSEKNPNSASAKKDILKSLILAACILASEIMIYLNWTKILSFRFGF